jgi:hypothetical protein
MKHPILVAVLYLWALPNPAATYFISPTGNDSNAGTSTQTSWASPKHSLNCGDVIVAASGKYSAANFNVGHWGNITCPGGNNVAWLQCATFDTCRISSNTSDGMWVDKSYWGVQGWEVTTSGYIYGACFHAGPSSTSVHHIIFANNVANGCMGGGFNAYDISKSASVDYIAYVGNIAYNSTQGSGACYSGLNIYQPIASDASPGTHMYIAGNFSYRNMEPPRCAGTAPTDGEGVNLDTFDFGQGGGTPYIQQAVVENNILVGNGGRAVVIENSNAGISHAPIFIKYNTTYGNNAAPTGAYCQGNGEIGLISVDSVSVTHNIAQTNAVTGCSGDNIYGLEVTQSNSTNVVDANWVAALDGNNTFLYASGSFAYGSANILGRSPNFANPTVPYAPSCAGTANVPACMESSIANFTPLTQAALSYGYQTPSTAQVYDPLFPRWLCNVNLPSGLVTMGCFRLHLSATVY